jgi:hypothetical protein
MRAAPYAGTAHLTSGRYVPGPWWTRGGAAVGTDVPAPRQVEGGSRPIRQRPEDVTTMITRSHLIGDLAAVRIRTLLAEADRLGRPPAVPGRTAPIGRRGWRRLWRLTVSRRELDDRTTRSHRKATTCRRALLPMTRQPSSSR